MVRFFSALGAPLLSFFQYLGELVLLTADTFRSIFTHKLRWKLFMNQIDALRALAVYPVEYLVVPRVLAMMVSMPLLVAECIAVGIAAGYLVAIFMLDINGTYYMANMVRWTRSRDIIMGLSKAFCFGI